ncbi:hypothetical protein AX16_004066 [Volvariella volvacea WC 439]|nr:hypothetical protein AX16_004066 [Volvariella volvacea WC 439]
MGGFLPSSLIFLFTLSSIFACLIFGISFSLLEILALTLNSLAAGFTLLYHITTVTLVWHRKRAKLTYSGSHKPFHFTISHVGWLIWLSFVWFFAFIVTVEDAVNPETPFKEGWADMAQLAVICLTALEMSVLGITTTHCIAKRDRLVTGSQRRTESMGEDGIMSVLLNRETIVHVSDPDTSRQRFAKSRVPVSAFGFGRGFDIMVPQHVPIVSSERRSLADTISTFGQSREAVHGSVSERDSASRRSYSMPVRPPERPLIDPDSP